ncbi:MAG: RsmD family RNA methyltransferase, partial [Gammaproteobacteria bacterium]
LDADPVVVQTLAQHQETLAADAATIIRAEARHWLAGTPPVAHDIVFVDPPFRQGLITEITGQLLAGWLKPHALVYLEAEKIPILELEAGGWQLTRQGRTRHVEFALAERAGP